MYVGQRSCPPKAGVPRNLPCSHIMVTRLFSAVSHCTRDTYEEFVSTSGTAGSSWPLRLCTPGFRVGATLCAPEGARTRTRAPFSCWGAMKQHGGFSIPRTGTLPINPTLYCLRLMGQVAMPSGGDEVAHWLTLAAEARRVAAEMTDPAARLTLLKIAQAYERVARMVDERRKNSS
jgi:hypothetical protein